MKLDLNEINKLSPPGLWDLAALSGFITTLLAVIEARIGGAQMARFCERMLARQSRDLRIKARENLNMRIKAWVLQSPQRIAFVRRVIGERAIKRWRKNRLADYALTKHFGDWKRKFPNGFAGFGGVQQNWSHKPAINPAPRTYNWKPFALVKIFNVGRFLYGRSRPDPKLEQTRAAYLKLWGVDIQDKNKGKNKGGLQRGKRAMKPICFTPDELVPEAASAEKDAQSAGVVTPEKAGEIPIYPPRKNEHEAAENLDDYLIREPP
ncbi:MAG: hypothetical protein L3J65_01165 [Robiginitomaculum sp.]|nr:hypothetical protein [Robiginitomaculum sp.]